jgi:hypothetical protein
MLREVLNHQFSLGLVLAKLQSVAGNCGSCVYRLRWNLWLLAYLRAR